MSKDSDIKFWFTTSTGKHIPVREGETKADALKKAGISTSNKKTNSKKSSQESDDKKTLKKSEEKKEQKKDIKRINEEAEKRKELKKSGKVTTSNTDNKSHQKKDEEEKLLDKKESDIKKAQDRAKKLNDEEKLRDVLKKGNKVETTKDGKRTFKGKEMPELDTSEAGENDSLRSHMKNGKLSPERQKLHNEIIEEYFKGKTPYAPGQEKRALFTGGGGAAGKGAFSDVDEAKNKDGLKQYYGKNENPLIIDPDALKERFSVADGKDFSKDSKLAAFYHEESSALAKQIYSTALQHGYPVMYDGTATGGGIFKLLDAAEKSGYSTHMNFIFSDLATVSQNSLDRYEFGKQHRLVPLPVIVGAHGKAYDAVLKLQDKLDSFSLWDNAGRTMRQVGTSSRGKKLKITNQDSWNRFQNSKNEFSLTPAQIADYERRASDIEKKLRNASK